MRRDGTVERKAFSRYFVGLAKKPDHEALVDGQHMIRDRKAFTKQMLRSFLKNSLYREAWAGAPWQVKERLAHEYRISTIIPPHLRHDAQVAQRKVSLNLKKGDYDGTILNFFGPQNKGLPELKPKGAKDKAWTQDATRMKDPQRAYPLPGHGTQPSGRPTNGDGIQFINQNPGAPHLARGPSKPPAIPIKYPREDLENPPNKTVRPSMKYLSQDTPDNGPSDGAGSGILMESVGPLLETWNTLNVYCEVFKLDSFTFDDYIEALQFTSEDVQSELVVEIHCAVLKILVKDEQDHNGQVQIRLPEGQDSSDEESSEPGSTEASPTPEPEVPVRTTRSSLAKSEAAEIRARAILDAKIHNGAELDQCVKGYGWKNRLRKRDLANGKWVVIVVGLLNLYSTIPRMQKDCERILAELAPVSMEAVEETAISQYASLDINLRVKILQFLCLLSLETKSIKNYMEECSLQMTEYRKSKMEQQRLRRQ